eukprot:scaffold4094_cov129-Isochrysis_galbana.AAC.1
MVTDPNRSNLSEAIKKQRAVRCEADLQNVSPHGRCRSSVVSAASGSLRTVFKALPSKQIGERDCRRSTNAKDGHAAQARSPCTLTPLRPASRSTRRLRTPRRCGRLTGGTRWQRPRPPAPCPVERARVAVAERHPARVEALPVVGLRLVELALDIEQAGQVVQRCKGSWVSLAEHLPPRLVSLPEEWLGLLQLTHVLQQHGEVVHRGECARVARAQHGALDLEGLLKQRQRLVHLVHVL